MGNTKNLIQIKRGLRKNCDESLMELIASHDKCEMFFKDAFSLYELEYNAEVLEQKRSFIVAVTRYFILLRLPKHAVIYTDGEYHSNSPKIKDYINDVIEKFYEIYNSCKPADFIEKFAEYYHLGEDRNFAHDLEFTSKQNEDDSLSSFAKAVKKVYNYKGGKK